MTDRRMEPVLESWFAQREMSPADVRHSTAQVMARIPHTRQRDRWWPMPSLRRNARPASGGPVPARGSLMFSALKFVTAGVIVALFGGLLMAGVLDTPQDEEVLPAAPTATASPEPEVAPEADPLPPADTVAPRSATLARLEGSGLEAIEYEPGVLLVRSKAGRDDSRDTGDALPGIIGLDGSWWGFGHEEDERGEEYPVLTRFGESVPLKRYWEPVDTIEVALDGTLWALLEKGVVSYDGESWTVHQRIARDERWGLRVGEDEAAWEAALADEDGSIIADLEVSPDGSVWIVRLDAGADEVDILRFDGEAWHSMGRFEARTGTYENRGFFGLAAGGDDVWLATSEPLRLRRYSRGTWEEVGLPEGLDPILDGEHVVSNILGLKAGPDGTLWLHTLRPGGLGQLGLDHYDGTGWTGWHTVFRDLDDEAEPRADGLSQPWTPDLWEGGVYALAPDGGIWLRDDDRPTCGGVYRYVGTERTHHFLADRCVHRIVILPDGDVLLTAAKKDNEGSATNRTFLIPADSVSNPQPA